MKITFVLFVLFMSTNGFTKEVSTNCTAMNESRLNNSKMTILKVSQAHKGKKVLNQ